MKTGLAKIFILLLVALGVSSVAMADSKGHQCSVSGKGCGTSSGQCGQSDPGCPIAAKFCKKACFILENKIEAGLTPDQIKIIEALESQVKKDQIRQQADMQIFMLDIKSRLSEDPFDAAAVEALVDQLSASMVQYTKNTVRAYAKLKTTVTEEQKAKLKALYAKK